MGYKSVTCIRYDKTLKDKLLTTPRAVYQHEVEDDPNTHDEEDDYLDDSFAPDGIDTASDDTYNVHNTNFKGTPYVKSLIHRESHGKSKPHKAMAPKLGIMNLSTSPSVFITCSVKTSRRS